MSELSEKAEAIEFHKKHKGKLEINSKVKIKTKHDLSLAYTPGVADVCLEIANNVKSAYDLTSKGNMVAVITDGTSVLGLGDIGPTAALPVMEGKAILFKEFAGVDAFPICLDTKDTEEIIKTIKYLAPGFGGINLEDISAPRCFEIESRLKKELNIPVFHDDQHGTAIVVLAGLINSLKVVKKEINNIKIVVSGAGAAGIAISHMLFNYGAKNLLLVDSKGIIYKERDNNINKYKLEIIIKSEISDKGDLSDALKNADVFIGVSRGNTVTKEMVKSMNKDAIIFAMANPTPEIFPDVAKAAGARIVATGRSDFNNQINNVTVFPGIFKGVLEARAPQITEEMKIVTAKTLANLVTDLSEEKIIPDPFEPGIAVAISQAIKTCVEKNNYSK